MGKEEDGEEEDKDRVMNPGKPTLGRPVVGPGEVSILGPDSATFRQCCLVPPLLYFVEVVVCVWGCCGRYVNVLILPLLVWGNDTINDNSYYLLHTVPCILFFF